MVEGKGWVLVAVQPPRHYSLTYPTISNFVFLFFFVLFVIFLYRDGGETTSGLGGWMDGWDSDGMRDARSW